MRRILLTSALFALSFLFFVPYFHVARGEWYCEKIQLVPGVAGSPEEYRCVENALIKPNAYQYLRGCLRCEDNYNNKERPYSDPAIGGVVGCIQDGDLAQDNKCTQDPRYILRNFPPLDYWSIGRALNLLIPLSTIIGAVISGAFFLYGGYTYVRASGDPKKLADAIHTITYSAAGLIFVMIAYVLVRTVLYMTNTNNFGF